MKKLSMLLLSGSAVCLLLTTASTAQVGFNFRQIDNFIGHTLVGDIDGDGRNDLIIHEHTDPFHIKVEGRQPRISWFSYPDYTNYTVAFSNFMGDRFALVDINADRSLDIISAVASDSDYEGPKEIRWYENPSPVGSPRENQSWSGHLIGTHKGAVKDIKAGDLDGDLDVVLNGSWFETPANPIQDEFIFHNIDEKWHTQNSGTWQDNNCYVGSDGDLDINGPLSYFTAPLGIWEKKTSDRKLSLNSWSYIQVDNSRERISDQAFPNGLKTFGLDMSDVTRDGLKDIVAGRYLYRNPGGDMTGPWRRTDLGSQYDGVLFVDVDDDEFGDIIAQHFPGVLWLEAEDTGGQSWTAREIGTLPRTGHVNGQGHEIAQLIPGGKPEILIATEEGLFYFEIPENPAKDPWPKTRITAGTMDEGIGTGDIDGDGNLDLAAGV